MFCHWSLTGPLHVHTVWRPCLHIQKKSICLKTWQFVLLFAFTWVRSPVCRDTDVLWMRSVTNITALLLFFSSRGRAGCCCEDRWWRCSKDQRGDGRLDPICLEVIWFYFDLIESLTEWLPSVLFYHPVWCICMLLYCISMVSAVFVVRFLSNQFSSRINLSFSKIDCYTPVTSPCAGGAWHCRGSQVAQCISGSHDGGSRNSKHPKMKQLRLLIKAIWNHSCCLWVDFEQELIIY